MMSMAAYKDFPSHGWHEDRCAVLCVFVYMCVVCMCVGDCESRLTHTHIVLTNLPTITCDINMRRHIRQELVALLLCICTYCGFPLLTAVLAARTRTVSTTASLVVSSGTYVSYGAMVLVSAFVGQALAEEELIAVQPQRVGLLVAVVAAACLHAAVSAEWLSKGLRYAPAPWAALVPGALILAFLALAVCGHVGGVFGITNLPKDPYYASAVQLAAGIAALPVVQLYYAVIFLSAPPEALQCESVVCGVPWTLISTLSQWLVLVLLLLWGRMSNSAKSRLTRWLPAADSDLESVAAKTWPEGAGEEREGEVGVILDVEGVSVGALEEVSFRVRGGMCLGIVGPVGSGKTSLIQAISGHTAPSNGRVILHTPNPIAIEQELYHELTVRDNLRVAARLNLSNATWREREVAIDFWLREACVKDVADQRVETVTAGKSTQNVNPLMTVNFVVGQNTCV
jgi:hypothetical protein